MDSLLSSNIASKLNRKSLEKYHIMNSPVIPGHRSVLHVVHSSLNYEQQLSDIFISQY